MYLEIFNLICLVLGQALPTRLFKGGHSGTSELFYEFLLS